MKYIIAVLIFSVSLSAHSFVNCFGKISNVYVAKNGDLTLHTTWKNGYAKVCSTTVEWKGVSVEACKTWLSIALSAQISKSTTVMQYPAQESCSDVGDYTAAPAPNYLMIYGLEE